MASPTAEQRVWFLATHLMVSVATHGACTIELATSTSGNSIDVLLAAATSIDQAEDGGGAHVAALPSHADAVASHDPIPTSRRERRSAFDRTCLDSAKSCLLESCKRLLSFTRHLSSASGAGDDSAVVDAHLRREFSDRSEDVKLLLHIMRCVIGRSATEQVDALLMPACRLTGSHRAIMQRMSAADGNVIAGVLKLDRSALIYKVFGCAKPTNCRQPDWTARLIAMSGRMHIVEVSPPLAPSWAEPAPPAGHWPSAPLPARPSARKRRRAAPVLRPGGKRRRIGIMKASRASVHVAAVPALCLTLSWRYDRCVAQRAVRCRIVAKARKILEILADPEFQNQEPVDISAPASAPMTR